MSTVQFNVTKRDSLGKEASKKFRRDGLIPAVVYGKNKENCYYQKMNVYGGIN